MSQVIDVCGHVLYELRNASVKTWPYSHFFVENVFPQAFYWQLLHQLSKIDDFQAVQGRYQGRTFGQVMPHMGVGFMETSDFMSEIAKIFSFELKNRYSGKKLKIFSDLRLVRDGVGYKIGPHTDAPWKLVSLLFYLPPDARHRDDGTSLYLPKNPDFRCPGGPHHKFEDFNRIWTAPYIPNSCLGFFKSDNSFHGVEPIAASYHRDVLLFNIYDQEIYLQTHNAPPSHSRHE